VKRVGVLAVVVAALGLAWLAPIGNLSDSRVLCATRGPADVVAWNEGYSICFNPSQIGNASRPASWRPVDPRSVTTKPWCVAYAKDRRQGVTVYVNEALPYPGAGAIEVCYSLRRMSQADPNWLYEDVR
jgi:hypothetical protein